MTPSRWREHPEARAELLAESDHLPTEIAEHFVTSVEAAVADVLASPDSWPKLSYWTEPPTLRRRKARPFRVNVVYYVAGDEVRVLAEPRAERDPPACGIGSYGHHTNALPHRLRRHVRALEGRTGIEPA